MDMKKLIYIFCAASLLTACTDDVMDRLNRNENDPEEVPARYLLTDAETASAVSVVSGDFAFYTAVYMEQQAGHLQPDVQRRDASRRGLLGRYLQQRLECHLPQPARPQDYPRTLRSRRCRGGLEPSAGYGSGAHGAEPGYPHRPHGRYSPGAKPCNPVPFTNPKLDSQESIYQDVFDLLDEAIDNLRKEDLATLTPVGDARPHLRLARCRPTGRALDQGSLWSEGPLCPSASPSANRATTR